MITGLRWSGPGNRSLPRRTNEPDLMGLTVLALLSADADLDPERLSVVTFTAVRAGDGWLFSSFQNTRKTAMPGPPR